MSDTPKSTDCPLSVSRDEYGRRWEETFGSESTEARDWRRVRDLLDAANQLPDGCTDAGETYRLSPLSRRYARGTTQ